MQVGMYVRHMLYRNRGEHVYRYGIIVEFMCTDVPKVANVFWQPTPSYTLQTNPYFQVIKVYLLEPIS